MRGDVVYRIYGVHEGREKDMFFGAFRTVAEAEAEKVKLLRQEINGRNWSEQYHNRGFVIRETIVETDFEIPTLPKPRDRYFVRGTSKANPGALSSTIVEVFRRAADNGQPEKICEYERNYRLLHTFEPFRQGDREFALISPHYTGTSVLDLQTGEVIAAEPIAAGGFCPVGFYVPDWWDVNYGSIIPGSEYWNTDREWPCGDFGFVWGCVWGDDSSWKLQYLDLSKIQSGQIGRDKRFGYIELATDSYRSPCFEDEGQTSASHKLPAPFIRVQRDQGKMNVALHVEMQFDLHSGEPIEWKRLRIANFE